MRFDEVLLIMAATVLLMAACDGDDGAPADNEAVEVVEEVTGPAWDEQVLPPVAMDDPTVVAWASEIVAVEFGASVDEGFQTPDKALGAATGSTGDVLCLGEGGTVTLGFGVPFGDGPGPDLAVFENGFGPTFLELAYVEVSSDGVTFARFPCRSTTAEPVGPFETLDPDAVAGLAGAHMVGLGTAFDLAWLADTDEVTSGQVDLDALVAVRLVDIVGDGSMVDSEGTPIYDPYPTTGSAGFDLEAVALLQAD